jgi:hypothetical protein
LNRFEGLVVGDDDPAQEIVVSAEEFRCRMNDNVGTERQRLAEHRGCERRVDDHSYSCGLGQTRKPWYIGDGNTGVAYRLAVQHFRAVERFLYSFVVAHVAQLRFDAVSGENGAHQRMRSAVELPRCDYSVAGFG